MEEPTVTTKQSSKFLIPQSIHANPCSAGVPHVVLPMWADCYNYAALAETIGVGVWACPSTSPNWTVEDLTQAFMKVLDGGEASVAMRQKARELGNNIQASEKGRDVAAKKVAELAYSGRS